MKKTLAMLLILALAAGLCLAALAEEAAALSWRGYALNFTWLTTDTADIGIPNLRTDGQFAMARLEPVEGTVSHDTVNEFAADEILLRTAAGEDYPVAMITYHTFLPSEGEGFPEIDPEQKDFDVLFFLEGGSEADLEGAALVVVDGGVEQSVALEAIPREKPAPEGFAAEDSE